MRSNTLPKTSPWQCHISVGRSSDLSSLCKHLRTPAITLTSNKLCPIQPVHSRLRILRTLVMANSEHSILENKIPASLVDLPPEIRNKIWRLVAVKPKGVIVLHHGRRKLASQLPASLLRSGTQLNSHRRHDDRFLLSDLAVAFSCSQIYIEVTPIYYGENTFHIPSILKEQQDEDSASYWAGYEYMTMLPGEVNRSILRSFTRAIGRTNAAAIRKVHTPLPMHHFDSYLSLVPGLTRLDVDKSPTVFDDDRAERMIEYTYSHPRATMMFAGELWDLQKWETYIWHCASQSYHGEDWNRLLEMVAHMIRCPRQTRSTVTKSL